MERIEKPTSTLQRTEGQENLGRMEASDTISGSIKVWRRGAAWQ